MLAYGDTVHQGTTATSDVSREQPLILSESGRNFVLTIIDSKTFIPVTASDMIGIAEVSYVV